MKNWWIKDKNQREIKYILTQVKIETKQCFIECIECNKSNFKRKVYRDEYKHQGERKISIKQTMYFKKLENVKDQS